jgi:predicted transcriptional regulator
MDCLHRPLRTYVRTLVKPDTTARGREPVLLLASAVGRIVRNMVALDRVQERRRAVALARHYRDEEDLSIAEIARQLGRAQAAVRRTCRTPLARRRGR